MGYERESRRATRRMKLPLTEIGKTVGGAGFGENITNLVLYVLSLRGVFDVQVEILTGQLNGRI